MGWGMGCEEKRGFKITFTFLPFTETGGVWEEGSPVLRFAHREFEIA